MTQLTAKTVAIVLRAGGRAGRMFAMNDQQMADMVQKIVDAGSGPIVSVMLDGRPDRYEDMALKNITVNRDEDGKFVVECQVVDLELNWWTADIRHICGVRKPNDRLAGREGT